MSSSSHPFSPAQGEPGRPHAVVIGTGFGGLAAAIRLGARGYRVTVLEKLDAPGGRAYVFRQDGFTFDAGPTLVTAPFLFEELWTMCGRRMADDIDLRPLSPFYRIRFHDGEVFDYYGDPDRMRAEVARLSPEDVKGYERFMKESEAFYQVGFEQLGDVPFHSIRDTAWAIPSLVRMGGYRSVYSLVAKRIRDPRLRFVFSFHPLFIGGNPFRVTSIYALISYLERRFGVFFPMGGTGELVKGLVGLIKHQGNSIRYGAEVAEVLTRDGAVRGVRLADGEEIAADIVVSNADSAWLYRHMVPAQARKTWTDRRIEGMRYSMSVFMWYFGTRRRYEGVDHHTILLGPRYREHIQDIFDRKILPPDFSVYLHRPTATDPSMAPEGCDTFYVLSAVPNLGSQTDWAQVTECYRQTIARFLSDTLLPDLENQVISSRILTPVDFEKRLLSFRGAAFGMEPTLTQTAWFRPRNQSEDIKGLYLVGAGTHPGAGMPGVLSSARILDRIVPDAASFT